MFPSVVGRGGVRKGLKNRFHCLVCAPSLGTLLRKRLELGVIARVWKVLGFFFAAPLSTLLSWVTCHVQVWCVFICFRGFAHPWKFGGDWLDGNGDWFVCGLDMIGLVRFLEDYCESAKC